MLEVLAGALVVAALILSFVGKAAVATAAARVEEAYPDEFARISKPRPWAIKGLSRDIDRARRALAGPLLTGFLKEELKADLAIRGCQKQWRLSFLGVVLCFALAILALGGR